MKPRYRSRKKKERFKKVTITAKKKSKIEEKRKKKRSRSRKGDQEKTIMVKNKEVELPECKKWHFEWITSSFIFYISKCYMYRLLHQNFSSVCDFKYFQTRYTYHTYYIWLATFCPILCLEDKIENFRTTEHL